MKTLIRPPFALALASTMLLCSAPVLADAPIAQRSAAEQDASFKADRADILNMAGDFKVTFDMRETTSWRADYTPIPAAISGGHESVRVVEDTGRHIVLQHLLVVTMPKDKGGKTMVIKHWRQDWTYEPETVLTYAGKGAWKLEPVPEKFRSGRWSQTVWQTDDSPRYGGWGQWTDEGGVRRWRSSWTWRPLARRDATRHPPYDRYLGINRHSPTPTGWIHWQDNIKMGPDASGKEVPYVQESVLNTYQRDSNYAVSAADAYWTATKDYWSAIRKTWDETIARNKGVTVAEVADTGSAGAERLMDLAEDIQNGKVKTDEAIRRGKAVIAEVAH
ncbi:DUF6607 family protein [Novosphingobium rosa]|uniref:DUF6607 family protein n=1 Tax=Novosphingobium rosa TaxID=76978 RepID=UPI0008340D68|nr:DUF6607 family protein [Novosphingobium rosa]